MRLETYLDAYAKAYYKFENSELNSGRVMRQRNKFRQRILDCVAVFIDVVEFDHELWRCPVCYYHNLEPYRFCDKCGAKR